MRRFFAWLGCGLAASIAASIVWYATVVHPNDARIEGADLDRLAAFSKHYVRAASIFSNGLRHRIDADASRVAEARAALTAVLPEYAVMRSRRFTSPHQVYVPVGTYPSRLEAEDGLFIPAGTTLTVEPALAGPASIRFRAVAPGLPAKLSVAIGGRIVATAKLAGTPPATTESRDFWNWQFLRFLDVDRAVRVPRWESLRADAEIVPTDVLEVACATEGPGCVISDVSFLKPAPVGKSLIVILVDTLRADALASAHAPSLRALAAGGTSFVNAMAAGNMTSPSTNALLSCRKPSDLGKVGFAYGLSVADRENHYATQPPSFPARFAAADYDTMMIGNVSVISEVYGAGIDHGFRRQMAFEREAYDTPDVTRAAVEWLAENGDRPFFLYLHYNGPHSPYRAPWRDVRATFPGFGVFHDYPSIVRWLYQSEVSYTDRYVAQVLEAVEKLGLAESATVVLTADHGDQHSTRKFVGNEAAPPFSGTYFDHGATLYDDEIRVPFVVRRPGAPGGQRIEDRVSGLDIGPTLLESFGLPGADVCSGTSLATAVVGGTMSELARNRVFGSEGFQGRAVYFDGGTKKLIALQAPTDKRVFAPGTYLGERRLYFRERQLFDLAQDPEEKRDLSDSEPALLARAEGVLREYYGIKDALELVVETGAAKADFSARFPAGTVVTTDETVAIVAGQGGTIVRGKGLARVALRLERWNGEGAEIEIGGVRVPLLKTSARLPLTVAPGDLPRERGGLAFLLAPGTRIAAYLRRVEEDGRKDRRIVAGNPRFEKVLREWGYLSDR